jgi:hypothetical protein
MDDAFLSAPASRFEEELGYEHLDHIVCHSVDRLDQRIHCVPRGWWIDPLAADIRGHLAGLAFRDGPAGGLNRRPNPETHFSIHPIPADFPGCRTGKDGLS